MSRVGSTRHEPMPTINRSQSIGRSAGKSANVVASRRPCASTKTGIPGGIEHHDTNRTNREVGEGWGARKEVPPQESDPDHP